MLTKEMLGMAKCRSVWRGLLVLVLLCLFSTFFALAIPTAHAASSSNTIADLLAKAGYVQMTQQNFRKYTHIPIVQNRNSAVISNATVGPFIFSDHIFSVANGLDVAAELGATGSNYAMLRARTSPSQVGPWEQFNWYGGTSSNTFEIQSQANGLFVAAELGATGSNYAMLRARTSSSSIGPWEQFRWFLDPNTGISVIQSAANGLDVAAELGATGSNYAMLRARTSPSQAGPWEQFIV